MGKKALFFLLLCAASASSMNSRSPYAHLGHGLGLYYGYTPTAPEREVPLAVAIREDLLSSGEDSRSSSAPVAVSHSLPSVPSYHSTPYETPAYEASPYRAPSPHHTVPYDPTPYSGRYSAAASDPIPAAVHSYGYSAGSFSSLPPPSGPVYAPTFPEVKYSRHPRPSHSHPNYYMSGYAG